MWFQEDIDIPLAPQDDQLDNDQLDNDQLNSDRIVSVLEKILRQLEGNDRPETHKSGRKRRMKRADNVKIEKLNENPEVRKDYLVCLRFVASTNNQLTSTSILSAKFFMSGLVLSKTTSS
jgi:hypothetical protein